MTNRTTATNYATEMVLANDNHHQWSLWDDSRLADYYYDHHSTNLSRKAGVRVPTPFLRDPYTRDIPSASQVILTKTHCLGYCDTCHHTELTAQYSSYAFEMGCRRLTMQYRKASEKNGTNLCRPKFALYHEPIHKIVHLMRNPFDNIVARMHMFVKKHRNAKKVDDLHDAPDYDSIFNDTHEGVAAWCEFVDDMFHHNLEGSTNETTLKQQADIDPDTMRWLKSIPCHSEVVCSFVCLYWRRFYRGH